MADERGFGEWEGAPESARHPAGYVTTAASAQSASTWADPNASPGAPALLPPSSMAPVAPSPPAAFPVAPLPGVAVPGPSAVPERFTGAPLDEVEELLDVEEVDDEDSPAGNGFHAFLRHASLHNLLQIESLSRTTGVFLVVSGGSRGYLHLAGGDLVHAETGGSSGEAAALEILSWENGEFKSCARTLAPVRTIQSSLQQLLLRLAQHADEALEGARRHRASQVVRRPFDQDAPTETNLAPPEALSSEALSSDAFSPDVPASAGPPSARSHARTPGVPAAGALPLAGPPVQHPSTPPPFPAPAEPEPQSLAEVTLSAAGEVLEGRGAATEEFSSRVAYAARLAELIGRAIRSGTPRALELRAKRSVTTVRWQPDGNLGAALFNGSQLKR